MIVRLIYRNIWEVWGLCDAKGEDPISQFDPSDEQRAYMFALLERIAGHELGPRVLPANRHHAVCDDPKIHQISMQQRERVLYVFDGPKRIVICHVFNKPGGKTQTVSPKALKTAKRLLAQYQTARAANDVHYYED